MKPYLIVAFAIVIVTVVVIMFFKFKRDKATSDVVDENAGLTIERKLAKQGSYEMTVQFDDIPALTEDEETRLVEVKNSKLLAKLIVLFLVHYRLLRIRVLLKSMQRQLNQWGNYIKLLFLKEPSLTNLVLWKELLEDLTEKWRIASKGRQTGWLLIIIQPII